MLSKLPFVLVLSAGVAGCASKPVATDNTPQNPTAVIEEHMSSNGIKGLFPFESDNTRYVRPAMQRDDSMFKGTGTFSGIFVGTHNGTRIYRVDRKLVWTLNPDKAQYTECPLRGCPSPKAAQGRPQGTPQQQQPQARREPGCTMRIANSKFTVTETGKKQTINGFDTSEYQVAWLITLRDNKARTSTSKLNVDLWTAPLTPDMREAIDTEAAYSRAFARAAEEPSAAGRTANGKMQILPSQATKLITAYLAGALKQGEHSALFEAGKQMEKIKGHPILTRITWDMDGNACAPKEDAARSQSSSPRAPSSGAGLASGLASLFAERETSKAMNESAGEPILSFSVEVKQLKMAPMHDGLFSVPANYTRVQPQ